MGFLKGVSEVRQRYGASRIPEGSTVEDWPFGYEELEPYYDRVEREIGVSGQAGNINGTIDRRGNPFEGARADAYPMEPFAGRALSNKCQMRRRILVGTRFLVLLP
ncbi:MAG: hypothetical protein CM1200mP25_0350 [Acidobacteriota bacterium]|nr:MAG: hypothetical protein CM1200mP25_0350 [Acidobacteriota bacterium]